MDLLAYLKQHPFVLSPMAGITDRAFRTYMRELGCGVVVTELVSAHGLEYNSEKTKKLMEYDEVQRPIGIQIFGETPEAMARAAKIVEDFGADFVDLNFGCPVPKVVKKGAGSAMLKDLVALRQVLRATKSAVQIPVTIKIRTGWDAQTRNADEVVQVAADEGITWVAIHGRTRAQGYTGLADWEYIKQIKAAAPIPILGNGDIVSGADANQRLRESGCDGVLIGRGCLKSPWIFQEALSFYRQGVDFPEGRSFSFTSTLRRLQELLEAHFDERLTTIQLKKFAAWYSAGYPGAAQFRKDLFQSEAKAELLDRIFGFYENIDSGAALGREAQANHDGFLMGGHG